MGFNVDDAVCRVDFFKQSGKWYTVEGRESEKECPVFQELVDFEEIRLLGPYWNRVW